MRWARHRPETRDLLPIRQLCRDVPKPRTGAFNPKVAGSIPARPIRESPAKCIVIAGVSLPSANTCGVRQIGACGDAVFVDETAKSVAAVHVVTDALAASRVIARLLVTRGR